MRIYRSSRKVLIMAIFLSLFCIGWFDGATPLITAIESGDIVGVKKLLDERVDVNQKGKYGRTPLMVSVRRCNIDMVKLLLLNGAIVNMYDALGANTYEQFDIHGELYNDNKRVAIIELLDEARLKEISYINNEISNDPDIIKEAYAGNIVKTMELIRQGVEIDAKGINGWTALSHAVANGDIEMIKILLDSGAKISDDLNSLSCKHIKKYNYEVRQKIAEILQDARIKEYKKKHNINQKQ